MRRRHPADPPAGIARPASRDDGRAHRPCHGLRLRECPFKGPFAIDQCVAEVIAIGPAVTTVRVGQTVIVPWAISCGTCPRCLRGLTSTCATTTAASPGQTLAAYGFGPASGAWGGMIADQICVPYADHMLLPD